MRRMYMVYDLKAETVVGSIILERNDAPAIRAFHDALEPKNKTVLSEHPEDFQLLNLGVMDDDGEILIHDGSRTVVATGAQWAAGRERERFAEFANMGNMPADPNQLEMIK